MSLTETRLESPPELALRLLPHFERLTPIIKKYKAKKQSFLAFLLTPISIKY